MRQDDITRDSVMAALAEFDRLGREAFLAKHGYQPAKRYRLRHRGRLYDSKAIFGVAYGLTNACPSPEAAAFSGGARHAAGALMRLGFTVYRGEAPMRAKLLSGALRIYARASRAVAGLTAKAQALVVGLLGCSERKLKRHQLGPDGKAPARDLYRGPAFRLGLKYIDQHCDQGLVLSAKHGVVELDQRLGLYDKTPRDMTRAERSRWGERMRDDLRKRFGRRKVRLVVLAGSLYASAIAGCGYEVEEPLARLGQGKRLQWLSQRVKGPEIIRSRDRDIPDGRLRFFLPDAQDSVDPSFDFDRETRSPDRVRQRDDLYAHEVFSSRVLDGVLLSKGLVEPPEGSQAKFSQAQRLRLLREGVRAFYRLGIGTATMGDCGAFTYVRHERPPVTVDEVVEFYDRCGFDYGISVDHIILDYRPEWDGLGGEVPAAVRHRQALTLELASEFWQRAQGERFVPIGVAQGWSPLSIAASVDALQRIGYTYIAIGGLVPLKSAALLEVLRAVGAARRLGTRFHLLGVARPEVHGAFEDCGAASCDSTSPIRQAFLDERNNYYTDVGQYAALRVPQAGANPKLKARIAAGEVDQDEASKLERSALQVLAAFDAGRATVDDALRALVDYEAIHSPKKSRVETYRRTLEAAPWKRCPCEVCRALGHHVIVFRGAERNRRRGFHNLWSFYNQLKRGGGRRAAKPAQQLMLQV